MKIGARLEALGLPLRSALQEASRIGAAGVQVDASGELAPEQLSQTGRREFRNLLRSFDLELTALGCPLRRGLDVAENLQPRLEHVRQVMQLSFDLGPRLVVVDGPRVPNDAVKTPRDASNIAPAGLTGGVLLGGGSVLPAQALREALTDLSAYGDRIGVTLALETGLSPSDQLAAYLSQFDTGALGVNYDPANMLLNGFDPIQSLLPLRGRIVHTHARDGRSASPSRTAVETQLGAGDIDWMTYVAVLESLEYKGWLVVDRESGDNRRADVANGVAFLKRFVR